MIKYSRFAATLAGVAFCVLAPGSLSASAADHTVLEDPTSAEAVAALTQSAPSAALDTIPSSFARWAGYRPVADDGMLVDPDGGCSSPVPLPSEFEEPCKAHDLGYDLLRFAGSTGHPLGEWARSDLDSQLNTRLHQSCSTRTSPASGAACVAMADVTVTAVEVNSWRQGWGVPVHESATPYVFGLALFAGALLVWSVFVSRRDRDLPSTTSTLLVGLFVAASLAPGLLPRSAAVQAVLTGVLAAAGLLVAGGVLRIARRVGVPSRSDRSRTAWLVVAAVVSALVIAADSWQNSLRSAMNVPPTEWFYWPSAAVGAVAVVLLLRGLPRLARVLAQLRVRRGRRFWSVAAVLTVLAGVLTAPTAGASTDYEPVAPTRSGSDRSLVSWEQLDARGRRFVTGGADQSTVRTYVGLRSAPTPQTRADLAVRELDRAGGFAKEVLVMAVPTGSGWVDENAITGLDRRYGERAAVVAVQYSSMPSWAAYLVDRRAAIESARAVFAALTAHIADLAEERRPSLVVYGQSLGSVAGSAAFAGSGGSACGAVWAGPPAGAVDTEDATVLAHSSDPVVRWAPSLLVRQPDLSTVTVDAPTPRWLPVVSFVQTTVDVVLATSAPPGHGHRYGTEQGTQIAGCGNSPRAASYAAPTR